MNDFEVMQKCRLKWLHEIGRHTNQPMPNEQALAAYHRGFIDALEVALGRVIADERKYVHSTWIPVADKMNLPAHNKMVLVAVKDSYIGPVAYAFRDFKTEEFMYMVSGGSWCPITMNMGVGEVTHWMPLPDAPSCENGSA
jgi:hypothetical protein